MTPEQNKKVLIGMPCQSGLVPAPMVQSLLQLVKPIPCAFMMVERQRVEKARNAIAMTAIREGFDYVLFVDDDNPIPPDTLQKFLEDDKDIIIAPILGRNPDAEGKFKLCAFYSDEIETSVGKVRIYDNIADFRDTGFLHRIDAGGTGCMLIKREVLEEIFKKHREFIFEFGDTRFDPMEVRGRKIDRRTMSEDCEFCERAVDAGFEIWLDDRIRPTHMSGVRMVQWTDKK